MPIYSFMTHSHNVDIGLINPPPQGQQGLGAVSFDKTFGPSRLFASLENMWAVCICLAKICRICRVLQIWTFQIAQKNSQQSIQFGPLTTLVNGALKYQ